MVGDITMKTRACSLLQRKNDLKELLVLSIKELWKVNKIN
jgi:hypothetical protein